jgi:hypothetical protein
MSTRANVYICNNFIAEIPSDAYPNGDFWNLMKSVDGKSQIEFKKAVLAYMKNYEDKHGYNEYLPPTSSGVGNWSYEYCWYPTKQPPLYIDWNNWLGNILVRKINDRLTWEGDKHSYWQVPGPWMLMDELYQNDK